MKYHFIKKCCATITPLFVLTPLLLAAGCRKDEVKVYNVSDAQDQAPQLADATPVSNPPVAQDQSALPPGHPDISGANNSSAPMPSGIVASDAQNAGPVTWTTPAGWTQVSPSEMRVASFKVTGANGKEADVSIVPLPGTAGGDSANVNRWRGQVGLPAASDDQLQTSAENIDAGGQPAQLFDLSGQNTASGEISRIVAAIQHRNGTTWFFKMTGDADLVEQQKPAFLDLLKTLSFSASSDQGALPPGHPDVGDTGAQGQQALPPGHPAIGEMTPPASAAPISTQGQPIWQVPSGWQEISGGQFLVAKFTINGDGGATAVVNVSSSSGNGGGLPANVNRWRGQLGLPPADEILTTSFDVNGGEAQMADLTGTNAQTSQPAEILGVMVTQADHTWFYKLMGDPKLVAAQKDAFIQFVKGVKY